MADASEAPIRYLGTPVQMVVRHRRCKECCLVNDQRRATCQGCGLENWQAPENPGGIEPCFTLEQLQQANSEWGCNCGPGAAAAILGLTLVDIRPHLGDFEQKGYTNPTLMWSILRSVGARWRKGSEPLRHGLARVQWEGPWTTAGVPMAARYRHTHWIGVHAEGDKTSIFDVNCMNVGGWVAERTWAGQVAPWILQQCEPRASGRWHITHHIEVERADG